MERSLVIRADASARIGTGHVMRCLALAQAWQDSGGKAIFVMGIDAPSLVDRLTYEGIEVFRLSVVPGSTEDARQTADHANDLGSDWVVVDGYHFGSNYQREIKKSDLRLLFIDDNGHANHYYADIVLNQNLHANEELYRCREPYTKLLLGTKYVLLRREFRSLCGWKRTIPEVASKVLVTLGGSDPTNKTFNIIQTLEKSNIENVKINVVIGGSNERYLYLRSFADRRPWIQIHKDITNMSELMAWSDVAISAAGSTVWELAFMGLPSLIMVVADNQYKAATELERTGCFKLVHTENILDKFNELVISRSLRSTYSLRCKDLVDGDGYKRILSAIFRKLEDPHDKPSRYNSR